jgi:hypothetical protein
MWLAKKADAPEQGVFPISESVKAGDLAEVDPTTESARTATGCKPSRLSMLSRRPNAGQLEMFPLSRLFETPL